MRKFISVVLVAMMVLSLAVVGVSAAEPAAVASAADFAAMAADGSYKLTADITIDATYGAGETVVPFTGTFDGNGHTVTVSVPMFASLEGAKVTNLTINGKIVSTGNAGAVAQSGTGVTISGVTNNASVHSSKESAYVGGMVGAIGTGTGTKDAFQKSTFTNCVNNGKITAGSKTPRIGGMVGNSAKHQFSSFTNCENNGELTFVQDEGATALAGAAYAGGIVGGIFHGEFTNCLNTGAISSPAITCDLGGIVGRVVPSTQQADHSITLTNCTNEGTLTGSGRSIGGILGYCGVAMKDGAHAVYKLVKCVNKGTINQTAAVGNGNAGGLVGYIYGQGITEGNPVYQYGVLEDCLNQGDVIVKGTGFASQFIGYTNCANTTITNCLGAGKLTAQEENHAAVNALSSATVALYQLSGNKIVENDGTTVYGWCADDTSGAEKNYANARMTLADAPAGAVTFISAADMATAVAATSSWGYQAHGEGETDTPATGDNAIVWVVVAAVAVLGTAVVAKKKFN